MKKTLYWDCFSGITGNMAVASLLDLGASRDKLQKGLASIKLPEGKIELIIEDRLENGIRGIYFNTREDLDKHIEYEHRHNPDSLMRSEPPESGYIRHEPLYEHDHDYEHGKNYKHIQTHLDYKHEFLSEQERQHEHHNPPHRGFKEIATLIDQANISQPAKLMAKACFKALAKAEAEIHGKSVDEIYFHETGARDCIADIVGTAICLDDLSIDKVYVSPIHLGSGVVKCAQGIIPVPAPATALLLRHLPSVFDHHISFELTTPTGAAILKGSKAKLLGEILTFEKVGHGHGNCKIGQANFLRAFLGTAGNLKKAPLPDTQNLSQKNSTDFPEQT